MNKKTIIILIVVGLIALASTIYLMSTKDKRAEKRRQKKLREQAEEDKKDPEKSTYVNEEGKVVSKDADMTEEERLKSLRNSDIYQSAYASEKIKSSAKDIKEAWGVFNDDEKAVYRALGVISNPAELLALRDYMNNEMNIYSLEGYLKKFLSETEEYPKALNLINDVRHK